MYFVKYIMFFVVVIFYIFRKVVIVIYMLLFCSFQIDLRIVIFQVKLINILEWKLQKKENKFNKCCLMVCV